MKSNQKKNNNKKTIYFTDINNIECLDETIKDNYHIFDRKTIIPHRIGINRDVFNYFNNVSLEQEFINIIKNKKISNIVYRLHYNNPDKILRNIRDKVLKKVKNKNLQVSFIYIHLKDEPIHIDKKLYDNVIVIDK